VIRHIRPVAPRRYNYVSRDKHLARFEISLDKGAHWIVVFEAVGRKER
jgi:hypothetical protein